mmetsp:Transcript_17304/g.24658  ORF Transcript_17304/g.24658 Transcript_17304/m.24658 type:complete len:186 (-) Transcript_17304:91-648(-)|eukprot:CAMPEP_0172425986 /NCGR_PEP_ID=MMETSP1064-20121228/35217_1 /TAXON_ID=202472 /ORGANISM="Aulacoseira subarctica , Strain CCAP 1002/5" /LENGTH=185 /DNA_ID=CAMNT_0013169313 /DNA_START=206 /DNA_END=763 /DNA_ORIENTATION=+
MLVLLVTPFVLLASYIGRADGAFGIVSDIYSLTNLNKQPLVRSSRSTTALNLDPKIARMVDNELNRELNLEEWKQERRKHDQAVLDSKLPQTFEASDDYVEATFHIQDIRDRKLAHDDPQAYCADRCLTTGYCDVFEDEFNFSAIEVVQFCKECVLSDGEEPCDIPAALLAEDILAGITNIDQRP